VRRSVRDRLRDNARRVDIKRRFSSYRRHRPGTRSRAWQKQRWKRVESTSSVVRPTEKADRENNRFFSQLSIVVTSGFQTLVVVPALEAETRTRFSKSTTPPPARTKRPFSNVAPA